MVLPCYTFYRYKLKLISFIFVSYFSKTWLLMNCFDAGHRFVYWVQQRPPSKLEMDFPPLIAVVFQLFYALELGRNDPVNYSVCH